MKQKIVIKVQMTCEKCKKKVLRITATTSGVKSMEIVGEVSEGKIMVIGEGVDSVSLTRNLRKKVGRATIESVEEVKASEKKDEPPKPVEQYPWTCTATYPPPPPHSLVAVELPAPAYPNSICTIM